MPNSRLPTDDETPTDADDFGLGYGAKGKGVDRAFQEAKPDITVGPSSGLPQGADVEKIQGKDWQTVESASELPTGGKNEYRTPYGFGNPMNVLDTIVDNDTPHKLPDEDSLNSPSSENIRRLSASVRGKIHA